MAHCTLSNTTILITSQHQLTDAENLKFINDEERWVYINAIFKIKITPFLSEFDAVVQISGSCYAALLDTSSFQADDHEDDCKPSNLAHLYVVVGIKCEAVIDAGWHNDECPFPH